MWVSKTVSFGSVFVFDTRAAARHMHPDSLLRPLNLQRSMPASPPKSYFFSKLKAQSHGLGGLEKEIFVLQKQECQKKIRRFWLRSPVIRKTIFA